MNTLLTTTLAAYIIAAIHSILAFINKRRAVERVSFYALAFGFASHTVVLIVNWVADGHYPLFGLRESLLFLAWTLVGTYAITLHRYHVPALGSFTLPVVTLLVFAAMNLGHADSKAQKELLAQTTTWLPVHTTIWIFAYAALFVVFIASVMYLAQERELKAKTFSALFHRLPALNTVNEIASTASSIGFALLTTGIITGIWLSWRRDGKLWHNDPKEFFAILTWLLYLALICYRSTASWCGRRAAWLGIAGFAFVLCTFLGARLLGGFHVFGIFDFRLPMADFISLF
jgi:ABC-type transport system involved in cytochrome c biogenesis permease subunit